MYIYRYAKTYISTGTNINRNTHMCVHIFRYTYEVNLDITFLSYNHGLLNTKLVQVEKCNCQHTYIYKHSCKYGDKCNCKCSYTYGYKWSGVWRFQLPPHPAPAPPQWYGLRGEEGGQERTGGCEGCSAPASTLTSTLKPCRTRSRGLKHIL